MTPPRKTNSSPLGQMVDKIEKDVTAIRTGFPARWHAYIRANYRDCKHICQVFGVSERTAGNWWDGRGGCNGAYVAIALTIHPKRAYQMLIADESQDAARP